jgi:putative nucleotidyltransferase with HDIG domain
MIERIDSLPPIPVVAQKILSIKISTDEGERALYKIIEKDPSIMSKIIGLSNSPIFGTGRKILTLHDAATLLGTKRIKMIALSLSMMSSVEKKPKSLFDIDGLWKHSLTIALIMDTIARYMPKDRRPPEDEIYLAGLLHDIGYLALSYIDPQLSDQFCMRLASESNRSVEEIEAELLDKNHSELGAELAAHWGLPESIIAVIRGHHNSKDTLEELHQSMIAISVLAAKLLPTFKDREVGQACIADEEWISLGIDPVIADEIKAKVESHTVQVNGLTV